MELVGAGEEVEEDGYDRMFGIIGVRDVRRVLLDREVFGRRTLITGGVDYRRCF